MDWLTPAHAATSLDRFSKLLSKFGIHPTPNTPFDNLALAVLELTYGRKASAKEYSSDVRLLYRRLLGLAEFAGVVLNVVEHPEFSKLVPHLRLLAAGDPSATMPATGRDTESHKLLELYVGALSLRCGVDLELDNPDHSLGNNPDVLITIRGSRWGFACKSPVTRSALTWANHIEKGVAQIEEAECDRGAVIFSSRSSAALERLWPIRNPIEVEAGEEPVFGGFVNFEDAKAAALEDVQLIGKGILDEIGTTALAKIFSGTKVFPGMLVVAHSVALVQSAPKPVPASIRFMNLQHLQEPNVHEEAVFSCLNRVADDWKH